MIEISQEEFEIKIKDVIEGKKSKIDLVKDLKTDSRTLNNKIQELSVCNPQLYREFVSKKPFKSKVRDDIDYEALVIEMVKYSMFTQDAAKKYNIGARTIQRGVERLKKDNPELVAIYKEVKKANKNNLEISSEIQMKIDELVERPVKITEINGKRKSELEEIERIFSERLEQYETKEAAAQSMGLKYNRIYKSLRELDRIRKEEAVKSFRDDIKVEPNVNNVPIINEEKHEELNKEGVEK